MPTSLASWSASSSFHSSNPHTLRKPVRHYGWEAGAHNSGASRGNLGSCDTQKSSPLFLLHDLQPAKYATSSVSTELELAAALDDVRATVTCARRRNRYSGGSRLLSSALDAGRPCPCRIAYQYVKFYHSQCFFRDIHFFLLLTSLFFQLLLELQLIYIFSYY